MSTPRITVFGAGIFGLSTAWALVRRGAQVVVVDPHGVAAGASGGIVGALAPHVPEAWNDKKAFQFDSLVMAAAMWAEVAEIAGAAPGYARTGRVQPLADDAAVAIAKGRAAGALEHWQGKFHWRVGPAEDGLAATPTGLVVTDTLSARIHPRQATEALATALGRLGVPVLAEAPARGEIEVWATGAEGLSHLSAELSAPIGAPIKGQAALVQFAAPQAAQVFADGVHVIFHEDGTTAIGSTTEREFDSATATDALLEDVIGRARAAVPALADAPVIARWAGLRPRARSRAPMIGPHPTRPEVFIANGGFKIGFGMAPKVGAVLADLILDGQDKVPDSFRVTANLR